MLGLSYLGQAPIAGIGVRNFHQRIEEDFTIVQPNLGIAIKQIILEAFDDLDETINYVNTTLVYITEKFGITQAPIIPHIGIILRQALTTQDTSGFTILVKVQEFFRLAVADVNYVRQLIVYEVFSLTTKLDTIVDGIKKLWQRCFTKRGEY